MSDSHIKGRRKTSVRKPAGIKVGKYLLPSNVAIPALMGLLFIIIAVAAVFEQGFDALVLRLTGFVLFAGLAYGVRSGLKVMGIYARLIDAFAVLFTVTLLWSGAEYLHLYDPSAATAASLVLIALLNILAAAGLIAVLLFIEKDRPSTLFIKAGQLTSGLKIGVPALLAGLLLAATLAYLFFNAGSAAPSKLLTMLSMLALFSIATGLASEILFRGLFLARLLPMAGKQAGFVIQAVLFAFFNAGLYYLLTANLPYAGGVLVVSAVVGYALAYITVKQNSIVAAALSGIGASLVIALPLFAAIIPA